MVIGQLLGYAAMLEGNKVVCTQSYGNEMRGGTANTSIIISSEEIGSPIVESPNYCIVMNLPSLLRFEGSIQKKGLIVINSSLITQSASREDIDQVSVPVTDLAYKIGSPLTANMVMLGAFNAVTELVSFESLEKGLTHILPPHRHKMIPLNTEALKKGKEYVHSLTA